MAGKYKNEQFALRMNNSIMVKIRKISEIEERTITKEIERACKKYIEEYEKTHGEIIIDEK